MRKLRILLAILIAGPSVFSPASDREPGAWLDRAATQYPPQEGGWMAPPPSELEAALRRDGTILLRSAIFDPLAGGPPVFSGPGAEGLPASDGGVYLVQFRSDLSPAERAALEGRCGALRFLDAVPRHAYLVRASRSDLGLLKAHPGFRWLDRYRGGYKVDPRLLASPWRQPVILHFRLFPGEGPLGFLEKLRGIEPEACQVGLLGEVDEGPVLRVLCPAGGVRNLAERGAEEEAVWSVEPWFLPHPLNDQSVWVVQSYDTVNRTDYALSATLWNQGLTGTGQTPAVCDTGCDDDMCFFRLSSDAGAVTEAQALPLPDTGTVDLQKKVAAYYVLPGASPYDGTFTCYSGTYHGTHVCGSVLGDNFATPSTPLSGGHDTGDGMAPGARLIFQDAGKEVTGCLDGLANDYALIFRQAYDAGARIHSNSWGNDTYGAYTSDCRTVDRFTYGREDLLFLFANGNMGSALGTVGSPASAKNCLSVGATTHGNFNANQVAVFSARGPTADGRRKPDVCAPGWAIVSAQGDTDHASLNCGTWSKSGTSMATPTVAGAATLLRQYFSDGFYPTGAPAAADSLAPSAALLKAALVNGAVEVSAPDRPSAMGSLNPGPDQGFGRVLLDTVCTFPGGPRRTRVWDRRNGAGLAEGEVDEFPLQVAAGGPLKVTLAWTDPESSGVAAVQLVNDLDLEVADPSGTVYRGNAFSGGQSAAGGEADPLNNVEEVFLASPTGGTWTVRVAATSVPGTPTQPLSVRQGYGLVATYGACAGGPPPPAWVTASDNGVDGVDLSWGQSPGATRYQVYRADGVCQAAPGDFHFIGQAEGTAFLDARAQGGYSYAYRVRAADACAEGPSGPCASALFTGNCSIPPEFSGLGSAQSDGLTPTCDVLLTWAPGASRCPLGNSLVYNIYRSTVPDFAPGPATLLVAGLSGASFRDLWVAPLQTYHYVVRAEDGTAGHGGPARGGNEDPNTLRRYATPVAATWSPGIWMDAGGDGSALLDLEGPWTLTRQQNHTPGGAFSYHCAPDGFTYPNNACASAATPEIHLQQASPLLTYFAAYNIEIGWDGVVVEVSADGGATWTPSAPDGGYSGSFSLTGSPPLNRCLFEASQGCFGGPPGNAALTPWTMYSHDLSAFAGQAVRVRWRLSSDPGTEYEGFYLDDIVVHQASVPDFCQVCTVTCAAAAQPASGVAPLQVSFSASADAAGCYGDPQFSWSFGDGATSGLQNPVHVYSQAGTHTWSLTVVVGGRSCSRSGTVVARPYDLNLFDDYGHSRLCVNTRTGRWSYQVLSGPGIGTYGGTGIFHWSNGIFYLSSRPGEPWQLSLKYYASKRRAAASLVYRAFRVRSSLTDSDSSNNPLACD